MTTGPSTPAAECLDVRSSTGLISGPLRPYRNAPSPSAKGEIGFGIAADRRTDCFTGRRHCCLIPLSRSRLHALPSTSRIATIGLSPGVRLPVRFHRTGCDDPKRVVRRFVSPIQAGLHSQSAASSERDGGSTLVYPVVNHLRVSVLTLWVDVPKACEKNDGVGVLDKCMLALGDNSVDDGVLEQCPSPPHSTARMSGASRASVRGPVRITTDRKLEIESGGHSPSRVE